MRVLIDIRHLTQTRPSGVGEYTRELLEALFRLEQPHEYLLLSTGSRPPEVRFSGLNADGVRFGERLPNVRHHHVRLPNKILNLSTLLRRRPFLPELSGGNPNLVFLPNLNIVSLPPRLPYVLTVHDIAWRLFPQFFSRRMRLWHRLTRPEMLIMGARAIITPSQATREDLLRLFPVPPERVTVIPHGVSPIFHRNFETRDHGVRSRYKLPKRFVVFLGTLEPRKNIETIIAGVARYRETTRDDLHLVLVGGSGWGTRPLQRRLNERVVPWTHPIGPVPPEDRPAILRASQALVWPSLYEGFGLPIAEAMASGTPIITSHVSSLPEVAGEAALFIDPTNAADLAEALRSLLSSPALQERLRTLGLKRAKRFSWDAAARATVAVFEKTLGSA